MNPTLRKMRVLESFGSGGPRTNPYLIQLARALEGYVDVIPFSWRAALFGDFDVFHVHWPELLIRGRSRVKTLGRLVLFSFLLLRIRVSHVAVVRTAHNTAAHESGHRGEKQLLGQLDFLTDFVIQLNPATTSPHLKRSRVVLHGDYRDWFAHVDVPPSVPGRVLYFGLIRRYKGVEALLESFAAVPDRNWRLHITGRPDSPEFALDIMTVAARDDRVRVQFGYLPDERLADEIGRAEIVVLPYKMMQNSGAAL